MTHYLNQTKAQAAASLQEFLDERDGALEYLRKSLSAAGRSAEESLDGTVESLVPLWQWILAQLQRPEAPGATAPASVPAEQWPSWERYTEEEERVLSMESVRLLDGLVSYLAQVVQQHAPGARWAVARHRVKRYAFNNHPVLVSDHTDAHIFLPSVPAGNARAVLLGMRESPADRIAEYANAVIEDLNPSQEATSEEALTSEPLVEVEDLGENFLRGRELELGIREDIAHEHSRTVDRLAKELKKQDGITGVVREDREVLLVQTSTWTPAQLEQWAVSYLTSKLT
ncbi:hypothetical protein GC088_04795 [Arthrobacter sp. JZ12]|uniref:hypothetical protein n=1 Tax=Arthrobacter sp. JZ12 TaxID=2654190 RepID=UPI002B478C9C|nr:hypothetical protein [Arthrobacter sp. JZ12]WRH24468.1 hypothetical protein GC088_04795 [Arthrobacter sp. JZ12]